MRWAGIRINLLFCNTTMGEALLFVLDEYVTDGGFHGRFQLFSTTATSQGF